jgi:hypothetical protein
VPGNAVRVMAGRYAVWVIGGLIVWAFLLAGFMVWELHSTSRTIIWAIFAGWCIRRNLLVLVLLTALGVGGS